jgi:putative SOS response-associated peptidase YedK
MVAFTAFLTMCGGVQYTDKANKTWNIYFPSPKAALPILKKDGEIEWVKWGKRKEEGSEDNPDLKFFAPGGWARLDSINEGKWKCFHPVPVKIPVQSFMEKDEHKVSHWIEVPDGQVIQGLLATHDDQARVYVVTTETPPEFAWVHDRWPRLVQPQQPDFRT